MATTLRTELTRAGANVATATIVFQTGVGKPRSPGTPDVSPTALGGRSTTGGTDPQLDVKFNTGYGDGANVPRCVAIDATSIYVWVSLSQDRRGGFVKIPITATQYVAGNLPIPNFSEF